MQLVEETLALSQPLLGAAGATITAVSAGGPKTIASSSSQLTAIDEAQYRLGAGPCLEAVTGTIVTVDDFAADSRWPSVAEAAAAAGVQSSVSVPMRAVNGSLNVYEAGTGSHGSDQIQLAAALARQLETALVSIEMHRRTAVVAEQLTEALSSRAEIEQAKGILMARNGIDADSAFAQLRDQSMYENRKLRVIAEEIVRQAVTPNSSP